MLGDLVVVEIGVYGREVWVWEVVRGGGGGDGLVPVPQEAREVGARVVGLFGGDFLKDGLLEELSL